MTDGHFSAFADCRKILLAVSGGPDSMALLHLAQDWSRRSGVQIEAATVDHRLRAEAAAESAQVGAWSRALGVPHHPLAWEGGKPLSRIQERAREARYDLLFALARSIGADAVLTAHHADDQAETVLFRLLRGSSIAGLAGMAPTAWRSGLRLGRPLLGLEKAELVALCQSRGQAFVEDPSNTDPKYARVRMRRLLGLMAEEGLNAADLVRLAARAARAEQALAASAARVFRQLEPKRSASRLECDLRPLRDEPEEFLLRYLMEEAGRLGTAPLRLERAERLAERLLSGLRAGVAVKSTLAGLVIALSDAGVLSLDREPPRERGRSRSNPLHVTV